MADKIETIDELRNALAAALKAGNFYVHYEVRHVHKKFDLAASISNLEIHNAIGDVLRSGDKPEVVFILGGGQVLGQIHVPADGDLTIEEELWKVAGDASVLHGGKVWLTPAPSSAYGFGILEAFRMPPGYYGPNDWPLIERFGVECGKFQQSRERVAA